MARFVIDPGVALLLASRRDVVPQSTRLVAPTLLRSQVLAELYTAVRDGRLERREAEGQLDHLRGLKIRLLGDRVLQRQAWKVAELLSWEDTLYAEYVALTQLQADALVTLNAEVASAVKGLVAVVGLEDVLAV